MTLKFTLSNVSKNGDKICFLLESGSKVIIKTDDNNLKVSITDTDGGIAVEDELSLGSVATSLMITVILIISINYLLTL